MTGESATRVPDPTVRVEADLVAQVLEVRVVTGQLVAAGEELVLLESMKMEIPALAERAAVVAEVAVDAGAVVQPGDLLVLLRGAEPASPA